MVRSTEMGKLTEERAANIFIDLLERYVACCDEWHDHYLRVAGNQLSKADEQEEHKRIQTTIMLPLMQEFDDQGFKYSDAMQIIPPSFETDPISRREMLDDLVEYAREKYGAGQLTIC